MNNLPPSPPRLPIIGNLHQLGPIPHRSLKSLADKYGGVMLLQLGSKPTLVISSANTAEEIRKRDLDFADRIPLIVAGRLSYNFKDMALSPYGEYWRQLRFLCVSQLLSNKRVQSFRSIREAEIATMLGNIRESCVSCSVICISDMLATLNNNIVSLGTIGRRYSEEKKGSQFMALFHECSILCACVNIADFIPWLGWINHINGMESKVARLVKVVDQYLESILQEGLQRRKVVNTEQQGHQNLLDVLLNLQHENTSGSILDRDSIKAVILNMIVGGTDTTYALLDWALSELLKNPSAMTRLQNEVRQFSGFKSDGIITEDDLGKFPYLKAVIKETLRLHPPASILVRKSSQAVKFLGYDIEQGTQVYINTWAIGRDPQHWENADEFQPERFLNSNVDFKGQHAEFLPFGVGRRSCPGSAFGLVIAELALANLVCHFNFSLPNGKRSEELDMTDAYGLVTVRKNPLLLVASVPS
ncbi:OLC1v1036738C1 [Oldenlandia corymbosa var. corymbosa]|uniref:OLC1v1036738C1 n=1 Tax=Oldenlandia corymbosa var. corymbosa TaxID=529605 RepID=A0AAV1CWX8_OLDCO|nr:OLC1v1036738C1 [Oldenlandia corymbosa var. corymbosa]